VEKLGQNGENLKNLVEIVGNLWGKLAALNKN
jgi:hypothetical protein